MNIIFLTKQPEICYLFSTYLSNHSCFIFTNADTCYKTFKTTNNKADLLILDYTLFNHDTFSIMNYLNNEFPSLPYIYYNDPCMFFPNRIANWKYFFDIQNKDNLFKPVNDYLPIFQKLDKCITEENLEEYVGLIKPTKDFQKRNLLHKDSKSEKELIKIILSEMKNKKNLTREQFFLAECIAEKDEGVSINELFSIYNNIGKPKKEDSLKVNISNLKSIFSKAENCHLSLIKKHEKYQIIYL